MLEKYLESVWKNDKKMVDYCMKTHKYVKIGEWFVKIGNKKPSIKKTMYYSDVTDGPEVNRENFIEYNKTRMPKLLDPSKLDYYLGILYTSQTNEKLATVFCAMTWEDKPEYAIRKFTDEEIKTINAGIQEIRDDYLKRLNKYFDRYGSKIYTCGYWADR